MSATTTETPKNQTTETPKVDPFVTELANSVGFALDENGTIKAPAPAAAEGAALPAGRTLSEAVMFNAHQAELNKDATPSGGAPSETPNPKPQTPENPQAPTPAAAETKPGTEEPPKDGTTNTEASDALSQSLKDIRQATPAPAAAAAAKSEGPKPSADDAEYIKGLSEEERETLEFASFAERSGQADAFKKTLGFFRARDKWVGENPGLGPDSQEFTEFLEKTKPKLPASLERKFIAEQAAARARAETAQETAELRARQRALELAPKVEKAVEHFRSVVVSGELKLPEGITAMAPEVAEVIKSKGFEAARKQFPVEAPIYMGVVQMGSEYLRVVNGLAPFDPDGNPAHRWIQGFVAGQEQYLMRNEGARTVDGRKFVPAEQYAKLGPEEMEKHWTFSDKDILDMIAANGHTQAHVKLKELEEAGFSRPKAAPPRGATTGKDTKGAVEGAAAKPEPPQGGTTNTPTTASPLAGVTAMPGAATTTAQKNPNAGFLDTLVPGSSQRL